MTVPLAWGIAACTPVTSPSIPPNTATDAPLLSPSTTPSSIASAPSSSPAEAKSSSPALTTPLERVTWRTVTEPFSGELAQDIQGLYVNAAGELVAWGLYQAWVAADNTRTTASFWSSPDGVRWRHELLGSSTDELSLHDVASGSPGYVAVGFEDNTPAAWWSPDGDAWTKATISPQPAPDVIELHAVAASDEGFLAVGSDTGRSAAWFSPNGQTWRSIDDNSLGKGRLSDVTYASNLRQFVVVGVDASRKPTDGAAWTVSSDGAVWSKAETNEAIASAWDDELQQVWAFAGGLLAFGSQRDPNEPIVCPGCGTDSPRLYTSLDGITWTRANVQADTAQDSPTLVDYTAIEPWHNGLIALGRGTDEARHLWLSVDGVKWTAVGDPVTIETQFDRSATVADLLVADNWLVAAGYLLSDDGYVLIGVPGS